MFAVRTLPRRTHTAALSTLALFGLAGCAYQPVPLPPTGSGPFGRVLFLGDSLTAGFENGALLDTTQTHGYPALLAQQAGFPISLPLIAAPGAPAVLELQSLTPIPVVTQTPGITTGRDNAGTQPSNLAVPGHLLHDVVYRTPTLSPKVDEDLITDLILGLPIGDAGSQLLDAIQFQPTTVFVWAGNQDALLGDDAGSAAGMTPLASFTADYTLLITALKTRTTARLVVANIPDVTAIPYLTPAALVLSELSTLTGLPAPLIGAALGIAPGELINGQGLTDIEKELASVSRGGIFTPLPGSDVLTAQDIASIQARVDAYNQVIAQSVAAAGGTLVDLHAYFASLAAGVTINGYHATKSFLGGLFGLDGVHPTSTAYALIANQFIAATNPALGLSTPPVNVSEVAAADPWFGPNIHAASAATTTRAYATSTKTTHIPAAAAERSTQLIRGFKEPASIKQQP